MSTSSSSPKALLQSLGLRAKKSFGQNFLADAQLLAKIAALPPAASSVVEIGAGLGALTGALLAAGHHVTAIERDRDLLPVLRQQFPEALEQGRLRLLEADAKQVAYAELLEQGPGPRVLMGNLPYNLTGPLLRIACELAATLDQAVFLVQLEVAERLVASAGTPAYGGLSVFVQAAYDVRRAFVVRRGAFYPQPSVDSAVVVLTPSPHGKPETEVFRNLVRAAFAQRRKTLRNSCAQVAQALGVDLERAATAAEVDLGARGESLNVEQFHRFSTTLEDLSGEVADR